MKASRVLRVWWKGAYKGGHRDRTVDVRALQLLPADFARYEILLGDCNLSDAIGMSLANTRIEEE